MRPAGADDPRAEAGAHDRLKALGEKQSHLQKIKSGRGWILGVGILCLLSGIVFYFIARAQVEEQIGQAEARVQAMSPEERAEFDVNFKNETGMTYEEALASDRRGPFSLLVVNVVLFVVYLGLWFWAKNAPFPAALIALIIFLTVMVINAVMDPKTIPQGLLVKILVIAGLGNAVSSAYKYRQMQQAGAA